MGIHLRGGQPQLPAIKALQGLPFQASQAVVLPGQNFVASRLHPQRPGLFRKPLLGKPGTCLAPARQSKFQLHIRLFRPAAELAESRKQIRGLVCAAKNRHRLLRAAEHSINLRKFLLNALFCAAGQLDIQLSQRHALLIRQNALGAGVAGEAALPRSQNQKVLRLVAPQR